MNEIETWLYESIYIKPLSPACKLCADGAKMVILITGLCPASCFYCPLSLKKGGTDVIYADEWQLRNEHDKDILIEEANLIRAKGAGITGGDPLSVPNRSINYIALLKNNFGESFHIHLYTSGITHHNTIPELANSGLNEIRFHPMPNEWHDMNSSSILPAIKKALQTKMDVAIEIPVIPYMANEINNLIHWADKWQIDWVNLNELEFSERNEQQLRSRGYNEKNDNSAAVSLSQWTAYNIIEKNLSSDLDLGVHYCSSSFKNGVQLKNRMLRRAKNTVNNIDIITKDATILRGFVESKNFKYINELIIHLVKTYRLTKKEYHIDIKHQRLQLPIPILLEIAQNISKQGYSCYISEQYPTHDQLEVERIPLPLHI